MKIAIIGADGQLGTDLCKVIPKSDQIPLTISDIDITNESLCLELLKKIKPDVVINTAAYHRVDDCEIHDIDAYKVNAHGVKNLALACKSVNSILVHISTDYVFDGEKGSPYKETDNPNPQTAYGISKLAGELFVRYLWPKHFLIRTCGLYGTAGCMGKGGVNFVESMIKRAKSGQQIKVVTDEIVTPTYTFDLAEKIYELICTNKFNLYHISNNGQCSWWDYTVKIFDLLGIKATVEKTVGSKYKTAAKRPKYSVLENSNLKKIGLKDMRTWDAALKAYLTEKGYIKN